MASTARHREHRGPPEHRTPPESREHPENRRVPAGRRWRSAGTGLGTVRHLGSDDRSSQRIRLVDAALRCLGRHGTAKTTVDDIAREAGLSRATLYRTFPGGKEAVLSAVVDTEVARLFSALAVVMGEADDLEDVLVSGIVTAARALSAHAALAYLLAQEPGVVLPHLAFAELDRVLETTSAFAAPFFGRWLEPEEARRGAEWAARIVLSYLASPATDTDLTDEDDTRRLVRMFVLPGILSLRAAGRPVPAPRPTIRPARPTAARPTAARPTAARPTAARPTAARPHRHDEGDHR